jgi:hypothetical protein
MMRHPKRHAVASGFAAPRCKPFTYLLEAILSRARQVAHMAAPLMRVTPLAGLFIVVKPDSESSAR